MRRTMMLATVVVLCALAPTGSAYVGSATGIYTWPGALTLTVSTSAEPTPGWVRSSDPLLLINCPSKCAAAYDRGAAVRLTAHPSRGLSFSHWIGAACAGQSATCTLTMNADNEVTAVFSGTVIPEPPSGGGTFNLTFTLGGGFAVTASVSGGAACVHPGGVPATVCNYTFAAGTAVAITTNVSADFWDGACAGVTTTGPCNVTMSANRTASACAGC